eukprot:11179013-Lingulodinium_polyedra.AAC.1
MEGAMGGYSLDKLGMHGPFPPRLYLPLFVRKTIFETPTVIPVYNVDVGLEGFPGACGAGASADRSGPELIDPKTPMSCLCRRA